MLSSCVANIHQSGHQIKDQDLTALFKDKTRPYSVELKLGPPSFKLKDGNNLYYYYCKSTRIQKAFLKPKIISYKIYEFEFVDGWLSTKQIYDTKNLNQIAFLKETTSTQRKKHNILKQLLGNFGRFEGHNDF